MKEFDLEILNDEEVLRLYDDVITEGGSSYLIAGTQYTCVYNIYYQKENCYTQSIPNSFCPVDPNFNTYYGDGKYYDPAYNCSSYSGGDSNQYFNAYQCGGVVKDCTIHARYTSNAK